MSHDANLAATVGEHTSAPPPAGSAGRDGLAPNALAYLNQRETIGTVALASALAAGAAFVPDATLRTVAWIVIGAVAVVALLVELPWLNRVHVRRTSYTVTPEYIYIARGWVWRRSVVIATAQVLNVDVAQGPLLRAHGLVMVRFTCITEVERLGPLTPGAAHRVRASVLDAHPAAIDG